MDTKLFPKTVFTKHAMPVLLFFLMLNIQLQAQISQKTTSVPMIRLKMIGLPNYLDETVLYYQTGATEGFDSEYDAYKLSGPNNVPQISQEYNSVLMVINGISPVSSTFSINIKTTTAVAGNFTITASDFSFLPPGTCVKLNDLITGASVNILSGPYTFSLSNTQSTTSRFVLTITHNELPITSELTQPTCQLPNGGKFKVKGNTQAPWNYAWKDSTGTIVQTSLSVSDGDSISNLLSGSYTVEITSASNSCFSKVASFTIHQQVAPIVAFTSPDTLQASVFQNFLPTNMSVNCDVYSWTFGDGIGNSNDYEPTYIYSSAGMFEVKLTGTSITGCNDSIKKMIRVNDLTTMIQTIDSYQTIKLLNAGDNRFVLQMNISGDNNVNVNLYDIQGRSVLDRHFHNINEANPISLDLNDFKQGIYNITISRENKVLNCSKLIIN